MHMPETYRLLLLPLICGHLPGSVFSSCFLPHTNSAMGAVQSNLVAKAPNFTLEFDVRAAAFNVLLLDMPRHATVLMCMNLCADKLQNPSRKGDRAVRASRQGNPRGLQQ